MYKERLKDIREKKAIKQEVIADYLKIHRGSYSKYEIENAIMPTKHLNALCNYFNISVDYLFGFTNNKNYENSNNKISKTKTMLRWKEYKISQSDLAESIGSAKTTISGYERGARIIATPFLYDICKKYKISADYLLGKTDIKDIL